MVGMVCGIEFDVPTAGPSQFTCSFSEISRVLLFLVNYLHIEGRTYKVHDNLIHRELFRCYIFFS